MNFIKKTTATISILLIMASALMISALAATGFSMTPRLPENQREGSTDYFDVFLRPGQNEELALTIENIADEEITVRVEVLGAATNEAGDIIYIPGDILRERNADIGHVPDFIMPDYLRLHQERFTIPAEGSADVNFTLTMPTETFQGTILGAINIVREPSQQEIDEAGQFIFEFAQIIAVRMQQAREPAQPDFELQSVRADLVAHRATFVANIINTEKRVIRSVAVNVRIYHEDSPTPIIEFTNDSLSMAPDSLMALAIRETESEGVLSGNYTAHVTLIYEDRVWNFEDSFELTAQVAAEINEQAANVPDTGLNLPEWAIPAAAIALLIIATIIVIAIMKGKANKKKYEAIQKKMMEMQKQKNQPQNPFIAEQAPQSPTYSQHAAYRQPQPPTHPQSPTHPQPTAYPQPTTTQQHTAYPQQQHPQQPQIETPRHNTSQKPIGQMDMDELLNFLKTKRNNQ